MRISRTRCLRRREGKASRVCGRAGTVGFRRPAGPMCIFWHGASMRSVKPQHVAGSATDTATGC